jgi:release factor glutamine methyltransferase
MSLGLITVAQALQQARSQGVDKLDAQVLLANILQKPRTWLLAHDDAALDAAAQHAFDHGLQRRINGEPLAYVIGHKEFHGLMLKVNAHVLVPRPDTEVLVDWACEILAGDLCDEVKPDVIDLGTGSGAIALSVAAEFSKAKLCATDISAEALAVAQSNAQQLGLMNITFHQGSWWQALEDHPDFQNQRFHLALSNPPYIAAGDPHLQALRFEPLRALTPLSDQGAGSKDADGLSALRALIKGAHAHLHAGAWLLLEHGFDQADAVQNLLREHGFSQIQTRLDLAGHTRCTGARFV